jgi:hypothetical protein
MKPHKNPDHIVKVRRYSSQSVTSLGLVHFDDEFQHHTIEDKYRKEKVKGETRIDAGVYALGLQELVTPMTERYRNKFDWFDLHLHVKDVPNFSGIYIHIGNTQKDSEGCLLVGNTANNNRIEAGRITRSTEAYKEFYLKVYPLLKAGKKINIEYIDLDKPK